MDSAICLYTKVALTTGPQTSLNWRRASFTFVILEDYCGREVEERWGLGGLPSERFVRTTPSRISENALLEHGVNVAIIRKLGSQKEN